MNSAIRVLGLDPGLRRTGWGVIACDGARLSWVAHGVVAPRETLPFSERLLHLLIALPLTLLLINDFSARIRVAGVPLPHWAIRLWSSGMMRIFGWRSRRFGRPERGGVLMVDEIYQGLVYGESPWSAAAAAASPSRSTRPMPRVPSRW